MAVQGQSTSGTNKWIWHDSEEQSTANYKWELQEKTILSNIIN
jgi:hypothetical protein